MATLTYQQIVQVARAGGLPGDPEVWAAIAMAESSGRTDVVNSIGAVGLWQINQPVHISSHPTWTVAWLQNPINNAHAAHTVYNEQGFEAWEAFTGPDGHGDDGPWRQYYQQNSSHGVQPAGWWDDFWKGFKKGWNTGPGPKLGDPNGEDAPPDLGGALNSAGDIATGIGTIAEGVVKAATWLGSARNWVRVGYVLGGGVLVLMGLTIVARPVLQGTAAGRVAASAAKTVKTKASRPKAASKGGGGGE
jgi:hypothetical protein